MFKQISCVTMTKKVTFSKTFYTASDIDKKKSMCMLRIKKHVQLFCCFLKTNWTCHISANRYVSVCTLYSERNYGGVSCGFTNWKHKCSQLALRISFVLAWMYSGFYCTFALFCFCTFVSLLTERDLSQLDISKTELITLTFYCLILSC